MVSELHAKIKIEMFNDGLFASLGRVIKRLDGFTYWNYDSIPSKSDNMKQAVQWLKIAKALHDEDDDECENKVSN